MQYSDTEIESYLRSGENEAELRQAFGDVLYDNLTDLAKQVGHMPIGLESAKRKAFILPGIMGSKLSVFRNGVQDLVWIDPFDIVSGGLKKLWPDTADAMIAATGTVLAPYMRMRLRLKLAGYDASFLPFDWRLSPRDTGTALLAQMRAKGFSNVALVGHSMGGLVARAMAAEDTEGAILSRVITVGTPNHGSYAPVEIMALSHGSLRTVAGIDLGNDARDIATDVLRHLPGLLQMLPDHRKREDEDYFKSSAWPAGTVKPLKAALTSARSAALDLPLPDNRFTQIVGYAEDTIVGARKAEDGFVFDMRRDGDGTVPRDLAETASTDRYYTRGTHGGLCNRGDVIAATIDLLGTGQTTRLPRNRPLSTTETLGTREVSSETLVARLASSDHETPARDTDYTGGFLSSEMWDDDVPVSQGNPDTTPRITGKPGNYPIEMIKHARARWDGSKAEREDVVAKIKNDQLLETESTSRLRAYTERLLTQVRASQPHPDPAIIAELETAVRTTQQADPQPGAMRPADKAFLERVIGEAEEFLSVMFIKRAVVAAASVGRIVSRDSHQGFGTGFMIAPGVLLTNHHVLRSAGEARAASVQFRFELEIDSREMTGHVFELEPNRLFHADAALDMAIVAVAPFALDGTPLAEHGHLPLIGAEGKIRKGQPVNIIQHPLGGRKKIVFRESTLIALPKDNDHVAHYTGDTQPGSSASPVFSDRWEVVALHHSGVPAMNDHGQILNTDDAIWDQAADPDGKTIKWIANEGIRISRIMRHLNTVPKMLEENGAAGADLVRDVLRISEEANTKGAFTWTPKTSCPSCEAQAAAQLTDETLTAKQAPRKPGDPSASNVVVPLELSIQVSVPDKT